MPPDEPQLDLLNALFEEAARLHGFDCKRIVGYVKSRLEDLESAERSAIETAVDKIIAFRAPDARNRLLN